MAEKMTSLNAGRTMMERTKGYIDALIAEIASLIPTKTSELDNDAHFLTPDTVAAEGNISVAKSADGQSVTIGLSGNAGSSTQPVYLNDGKPTACSGTFLRIYQGTSAPAGNTGVLYINTSTNTPYYYNGSSWVALRGVYA